MEKITIPLSILVARVSMHNNDNAEIFGFWYWNPPQVPTTVEGMSAFFMDTLSQKSCQTIIKGTAEQVYWLFGWVAGETPDVESQPYYERAMRVSTLDCGQGIVFVDLANPKPDFVPLDCNLDVVISKKELIQQLKSGVDKIELLIHPDWSGKIF
ncbi:MAG: hypothetical protein HQK83_11795 [Fibrobacteria bacterium]|nr:hypothetical protein [Fibrobacteria bacterium]